MPATDQERTDLQKQLALHKRRLALLETQAAGLGWRADPAVSMEIVDLRAKIAEITEILKPPKQLSEETWAHMSHDDQMRYATTLILQLNADFESYYLKTRHLIRVGIIWLIVVEALGVLFQWLVR